MSDQSSFNESETSCDNEEDDPNWEPVIRKKVVNKSRKKVAVEPVDQLLCAEDDEDLFAFDETDTEVPLQTVPKKKTCKRQKLEK